MKLNFSITIIKFIILITVWIPDYLRANLLYRTITNLIKSNRKWICCRKNLFYTCYLKIQIIIVFFSLSNGSSILNYLHNLPAYYLHYCRSYARSIFFFRRITLRDPMTCSETGKCCASLIESNIVSSLQLQARSALTEQFSYRVEPPRTLPVA